MSAAETQAISGAAQGAAYGFMIGGPVGGLVGGGLGLVGGFLSGSSADRQFKNQMAWANYNNIMQYNIEMANIQAGLDITAMNVGFNMAMAEREAAMARAYSAYNAEMIAMTTNYNSLLMEQDLLRVWEQENLDLTQLELYRVREQGSIVADQSASGTIIGEGSNEAVIVSQQTMRELDKTIIMHGADIQAAEIRNQMAQGVWQGQVAIGRTLWEGEMQAYASTTRAAASSASALGTAAIQAKAGIQTADYALQAGFNNVEIAKYQNKEQNFQNLIGGLFQAGGVVASAHYANKVPGSTTTTPSGGSGFHPRDRFTAMYTPPSYQPGTSLITGP